MVSLISMLINGFIESLERSSSMEGYVKNSPMLGHLGGTVGWAPDC